MSVCHHKHMMSKTSPHDFRIQLAVCDKSAVLSTPDQNRERIPCSGLSPPISGDRFWTRHLPYLRCITTDYQANLLDNTILEAISGRSAMCNIAVQRHDNTRTRQSPHMTQPSGVYEDRPVIGWARAPPDRIGAQPCANLVQCAVGRHGLRVDLRVRGNAQESQWSNPSQPRRFGPIQCLLRSPTYHPVPMHVHVDGVEARVDLGDLH